MTQTACLVPSDINNNSNLDYIKILVSTKLENFVESTAEYSKFSSSDIILQNFLGKNPIFYQTIQELITKNPNSIPTHYFLDKLGNRKHPYIQLLDLPLNTNEFSRVIVLKLAILPN